MNRVPEGAGIGLRWPHIPEITEHLPEPDSRIGWLELLADNHLHHGSLDYQRICYIAEHYPVVLHSVGMNLAGVDPLDFTYLARLKQLARDTGAAWISDHACFSSAGNAHSHDLLPLPMTSAYALYLAERVRIAQDYMEIPLLLENVSVYVRPPHAELSEGEFLAEVAERSDCQLLLDINNFQVNFINFGDDARQEIARLPAERIWQIHLGGYEKTEWGALDTHGNPVWPEVWDLFRDTVARIGSRPTLIEWDNNVPSLTRLLEEAALAQQVLQSPEAA